MGVVSSNTVKAADVRSGAQDATALTSYVGNVLDVGGNVLTVTSDTKFIIISGSTADKVILDGTADDIIYQADDPNTAVNEAANNSKVVASRVSNTATDAGYNLAAYVYIFR